jgi:hypothetical protein
MVIVRLRRHSIMFQTKQSWSARKWHDKTGTAKYMQSRIGRITFRRRCGNVITTHPSRREAIPWDSAVIAALSINIQRILRQCPPYALLVEVLVLSIDIYILHSELRAMQIH